MPRKWLIPEGGYREHQCPTPTMYRVPKSRDP
jgi:hypothetical protein